MLHLLGKVVKRKEVRIPQPKAVREADALAGVRLAAPRVVAELEAPLPAADRIVPGSKGWE
jgi:hypothetical protein